MALTDTQKLQVRRHLGYPVIGSPHISPTSGSLASGFAGYRFFTAFGQLEYKLNNLQSVEEAVLTGISSAEVLVSSAINAKYFAAGLEPQLTLANDVDSDTISYTTQENDTRNHVAVGLMNAILASTILVNAGFSARSPLSMMIYKEGYEEPDNEVIYPTLQITSLSDFTISYVSDLPLIISGPITATRNEPTAVIEGERIYGFLPILSRMEGDIAKATENLDTEKADVWTARKDEVQERRNLYKYWRERLAEFIGVPLADGLGLNPGFKGRNSNGIMVA